MNEVCSQHSGVQEKLNNLEERVDKMEGKLDSIHKLLVGTLTAAVTSLILLAVNLAIKGGG